MVKFMNYSRPLSVFQVLFKASLIFKDFSRQSCIFKYFSSLCESCIVTSVGYDEKETNLKNCSQLNKVIIKLYLHKVKNEKYFLDL